MEIQKLFVSLLLDAADYTGGLDDAQKEASSFRDRIGSTIGDGFKIAQGVAVAAAAVIATAVIGIGAAAFSVSNDVATATANIQAELGTTAEESERLAGIATAAWGNNFAGSITEAAAAVGIIRQQLGDMSDNELQDATENAFRLSDAYGIEVPESINAVDALMSNFGMSQQEAFDFIAKGMQNGLNSSDDFLDSIGEYSNQFADAGFGADGFFSVMESGQQSGVLGTDKIADAIKEMNIRLVEGGEEVAGAFDDIGMNFSDVQESVANGESTWADYFDDIVGGINGIEDPIARQQAQVAIFGTMAEDLGVSFTEGLSSATTSLDDMGGAVDAVDAKYNNLGSVVEGFKRRGLLALKPIGDILLNLANSVMPIVDRAFAFFETNIAPAIETVAGVIQRLIDNISNGMTPINAISGALSELFGPEVSEAFINIVAGIEEFIAKAQEVLTPIVTWVQENVQLKDVLIALGILLASVILPILGSLLLSILAIAAPIVAVIAIVALLRTAWEQNWGGIQEKTAAAVEFIRGVITAVMAGVQAFWAQNGEAIMAKAREIWTGIQTAVNTAITTIQNIITTISTAIQTFWATHGETIMDAAQTAWDFISSYVETALSVVSSVFAAFKSAFEGDWTGFGANLRAAWDTAWEFIKNTFTNAKETIIGIAAGLVLDLIAKFQNTDWGAVGMAIINGIANGIRNGAGAIADAATAAAQAALDAAKAFLGIESPSKVAAMQIGEPFTEGLAIGLGDVAPIQRSVADLVNEMTLPFATVTPTINTTGTATAVSSPAPSGGGSSGDTFIFNIDAPGGNADAIEKAVERAMAKSGRRADVRIRTG